MSVLYKTYLTTSLGEIKRLSQYSCYYLKLEGSCYGPLRISTNNQEIRLFNEYNKTNTNIISLLKKLDKKSHNIKS